jgi:hypothetical protein
MNTDSLTLHVGADYISAFALSAFVALTEKNSISLQRLLT